MTNNPNREELERVAMEELRNFPENQPTDIKDLRINELEAHVTYLEEKLAKIDTAISDAMKETKIGIVAAGPYHTNNGVRQFRVEDNVFPTDPEFTEDVFPGDQVIIMDNLIINVIPAELEIMKPKNVYNLASWEDIIGLEAQIAEVKSLISTLKASEADLAEYGMSPSKGLLLYGFPGCGKTLIAKAVARDLLGADEAEDGQFIYIKGAEILNKYVGESEGAIVRIFKKAREYAKESGKRGIIFIDEADAILGNRSSYNINGSVVPTFLSEMDGLEPNGPFVLLSTNLPNSLDPAVIREGRVDMKLKINRPTPEATYDLFEYYLNKVKLKDSVEDLAAEGANVIFSSEELRADVSGAMVATVINLAAKRGFHNKRGILKEDLVHYLKEMELSRKQKDTENYLQKTTRA